MGNLIAFMDDPGEFSSAEAGLRNRIPLERSLVAVP